MTYDVFISYAHEEVKTARRLEPYRLTCPSIPAGEEGETEQQ